MIAWWSRRTSAARREDGFTIIELTVAMFITLLVMGSLAGVFIASISGVALDKQRQSATALATAAMEQFRAIDYATIQGGLTCNDVVGDPRVVLSGPCGAGVTGRFVPGVDGIDEELVLQSSGASAPPLLPHISARKIEKVTYSVASYVSRVSSTSQAFNLTVIASWSSSVSKGTKQVVQRSVNFSPSRCLSSATHPYAGACQASFNGDAGLTKSGFAVLNADDGTSAIPGVDGSRLDLTFNALSATMSSEQLSSLSGLASATKATTLGSTTSSSGGATKSVSADTDPGSVSGGVDTGTVSQGSSSTLSLSGTGAVLSVTPTSSDSGQLDVRTASGAGTCYDAAAALLNVLNQPCSWTAVRPAGDSAVVRVVLPGGAPNFNVARFGPAPASSRAVVAKVGTSGGAACPTTSGVGCVTSQASRSLGEIRIGGLPDLQTGDTPPAGWNGSLIKVDGLQESAFAEAGPGHRDPTFTRTAGTLSYYDAASGTRKTLSDFTTLTSDFVADLGTSVGTYKWGGHFTVIKLSGTMRVGAATPLLPSLSTPDPTCRTSACTYSATPASTLVANLVYDITIDGAPATRFAITADLGALVARASYKAAFDA